MGSYVSKAECPSQGIVLKCDIVANNDSSTLSIGGLEKGQIPPDGDIAGIGIVSVFIGVTSLALALSVIDVFWTAIFKPLGWKSRATEEEKQLREARGQGGFSLSRLCETIILSCSDQQLFTGGAYALTLRYAQGCFIRAYHYNIVANMMLLTCATHLMSITLVRDYWRYPWLGALRVVLTFGVFLVTGMLLANQNANGDVFPFPASIPPPGDDRFLMFRHAACFQDSTGQLKNTLDQTFGKGSDEFARIIGTSTPANRIPGWNYYIIIMLWYAAAIVVELVRLFRRGADREGLRKNVCDWLVRVGVGRPFQRGKWPARIVKWLLYIYLVAGIVLSGVTVGESAAFIMDLRTWARETGWLEEYDSGRNATTSQVLARVSSEDVATTFGQMVPIFTTILTLIAIIEKMSEMLSGERAQRKYSLSGNVTPAGLSRANTFQPMVQQNGGGGQNGTALPAKMSPEVYEGQAGMAVTPGMMASMTPMTPGFPGMGLAIDGSCVQQQQQQQFYPQTSPYSASQLRFSQQTGTTPLLAGSAGGGFFPAMYVPGSGGGGGGYFVSASNGSVGGYPTSTVSSVNPSTPGFQVVMPTQQQQQQAQQQAQGATTPSDLTSASLPSLPIGTALGVPPSMLQQSTQAVQPQPQQEQRMQQQQPQDQQVQPSQQQQQQQTSATPTTTAPPQAGRAPSVVISEPVDTLRRRAT